MSNAPISGHRYSRVKAVAYNAILEPHAYFLFALLMGDRLGRTLYEQLGAITKPRDSFSAVANRGLEAYWQRHSNRVNDVVRRIEELKEHNTEVLRLPYRTIDNKGQVRTLLRLPVLVKNSALRDRWMSSIKAFGIGATEMYGRALPEIVGEGDVDLELSFPVATDIAARLLTLPVHEGMTDKDIENIGASFRR